VSIRDHFHLIGFVMTKEKNQFLERLKGIEGISVKDEPAGADPRLTVPVKLKNNLFTRAFEMFVQMYGSPSYGDIDPTPFVAYTYTILFGMMFGDLGHGLCVVLAGLIMWRAKGMQLGRIIERIGVASMFFGFWYGSVFGNEHLLDPVFRLMGFHEKPIEVMRPDTTNMILIAAVAVGVIIILASIVFNICIGIKKKDIERTLLSSNGVCGFIFYASILFGVVMTVSGTPVMNGLYILFLIVLPLLLIFFREPIGRLIHMINSENELSRDTALIDNSILEQEGFNITELFSSHFMAARFGRIPTDSYKKLTFYQNEPFMLYPVKTDDEYIWLLYAMSTADKETIDAIFHDLYFERIYIPDEDMESPQKATAFIRRCVDTGGTPEDAVSVQKYGNAEITSHRTIYKRMFPDGFGEFFAETFFEMFEIILSFISNTVSFLRVGGFVLVHAGMMSVVMTLSAMSSGGGTVAILVLGNIFVMLIEGLIVGIQVLRLEFYEIFSRFYDAGGEEFVPVTAEY
jgi:V/A-type H+-transporting ATPase subunit I